MTDFDPNEASADEYVVWCADNYHRLCRQPRTYRTAVRCAHWLLVVATGGLQLNDTAEDPHAELAEQLEMYYRLARALERQRQRFAPEQLIVLRSSLDCWEGVVRAGDCRLNAARCAASALLLIDVHPLIDLWELRCPDVWGLLDVGASYLTTIGEADDRVQLAEGTAARYTWQRAHQMVRHLGVPPFNAN